MKQDATKEGASHRGHRLKMTLLHTSLQCSSVFWAPPPEKYGVVQLRHALHARAVAAPEAVQGVAPGVAAVPLAVPRAQGH